MKPNLTYEDFEKYLNSGNAENVDAVTKFFTHFIMSNAKALYRYLEYRLGSNSNSEDTFQEVMILCLQDLATQTSGGKPKFEYRGKSESELLGHVKLKLHFLTRSIISKQRKQGEKYPQVNIDDHLDTELECSCDCDEQYCDEDRVYSVIESAFQKVRKIEHRLGLSLSYGLHNFEGDFNPDNVARLAASLGGNKEFVSGVEERTKSLLNLTSDVKLDTKKIAHIVGMETGNFQRVNKAFKDTVENSERLLI